ncbi:MAG: methyltransferase [Pseudomonadota bacterium]
MLDAWLNFRERCLTSPRFHRFAAWFWPTRPVVRTRQSELFDIVSGFVYSQVLAACVETGALEAVRNPGKSLPDLAGALELREDETRRLADAAVSLRLMEKSGSRYRLGDLGSALLINPGVLAMIRHHGALYKDLTNPVALLREGRGQGEAKTNLSRYWAYAMSDDPAQSSAEQVAEYSTLMAESQKMVATEVLASFNFRDHNVLLDVGGGEGAFIKAVAAQHDHLQLRLFDLPQVAERAASRFEEVGLSGRTQVHGGSFFDDPLPQGADLASLVRILHDHDDEPAQAILDSVYAALPSGGKLLIAEPMSTGGSAHRISDAYFNFYLYAMGSGRPRSPALLFEMLKRAGFARSRSLSARAPLITSFIVAEKA